jgi:hypothetical protein
MPVEPAVLHLSVHTADHGPGEDRQLVELLRRVLVELGLVGDGRMDGVHADGELRLTVDRSPAVLAGVVDAVCAWLRRQPPLAVSLRMGDANLTLGGGGSHAERDRTVHIWIDRALAHDQPRT